MSSSTSSSDAAGAAASWRRFVLLALGTALGLVGLVLAAAVALDPYDTGRFGLWPHGGVRPQGPRTAGASRGRDPQFSAAILGNSHMQLLSPARLDGLTGERFVSLTVPGSRPREQLAMLDWFVRVPRPRLAAVAIGIDGEWCRDDPALPLEHPFPFWLYSPSTADYLAGLVRVDVVEELPKRVTRLLSASPRLAAADGYWDYEPTYVGLGYGSDPRFRERLALRLDTIPINRSGRFPAAERLEAALAGLPARVAVVLVVPPVHATGLPAPGSPQALTEAGCKAAFGRIAAGRPNVAMIDLRTPTAEAVDADLWFDHTHYRAPVAMAVERALALALARLR